MWWSLRTESWKQTRGLSAFPVLQQILQTVLYARIPSWCSAPSQSDHLLLSDPVQPTRVALLMCNPPFSLPRWSLGFVSSFFIWANLIISPSVLFWLMFDLSVIMKSRWFHTPWGRGLRGSHGYKQPSSPGRQREQSKYLPKNPAAMRASPVGPGVFIALSENIIIRCAHGAASTQSVVTAWGLHY